MKNRHRAVLAILAALTSMATTSMARRNGLAEAAAAEAAPARPNIVYILADEK